MVWIVRQLLCHSDTLQDYGARYYLPNLRRFISADTVVPGAGNPQALNRFAYTVNNPLKYIDPTGHMFGGFTRGLSEYVHYNRESGTYERGFREIIYPSSQSSNSTSNEPPGVSGPQGSGEQGSGSGTEGEGNSNTDASDVFARLVSVSILAMDTVSLTLSSSGVLIEGAGCVLGDAFVPVVPGVDGVAGCFAGVDLYRYYINRHENRLGWLTFMATVLTDTEIKDGELIIGPDAAFVSVSSTAGQVAPDAVTDTVVNIGVVYYDLVRLNGEEPVWGLFQGSAGFDEDSIPYLTVTNSQIPGEQTIRFYFGQGVCLEPQGFCWP